MTAHTGESEEDRTERGEGRCTHVPGGKEWPRRCPAWSHLHEKREGGRNVNSSPGCGGGLHKTARQRQAETGIWMTASLRDGEGRLIHLQLQPLGGGQRRWNCLRIGLEHWSEGQLVSACLGLSWF